MTQQSVSEFLSSIGVKSFKFAKHGDTVQGRVLTAEVRHQTELGGTEVLTYPDGKPKKQLVITIQTDLAEDEEDDGKRRIYAKGQMLFAVRNALNGQELKSGGKIAVRYTGDGEPFAKGYNAPKQYKVWYEAPLQSASLEEDGLDYEDEESQPWDGGSEQVVMTSEPPPAEQYSGTDIEDAPF